MIEAVAIMGSLGLVVGVGLALASKVFYVYVDPKIEAVEGALPGANCGGCGLPGCSANAAAIVAGKASPGSCVAGGPDIALAIAELLGVAVEQKEPDIARPGCTFGVQDADLKYLYNGLIDCRAAAMLSGGMKVCTIGCLGLGTCARVCPFGAITMGPDNLPVVSEKKCTGCGTCERACPKHIITLSSVTRRILREYTTDDCTTPCQRTCPAGINIREYVRQISLGNPGQALQVIMERNPFPATVGRICPRPCETECRRKYVDQPVSINDLKCYAADTEMRQSQRQLPYRAPQTGRRIAVVGGGAGGLSTAFFSARLGHEVTVFEATDKLGGLLRSAIGAERLPAAVLDWDIDGILQMGVQAETGKTLGTDITVAALLKDGFDAVYLAAGGWDSRLTRYKGFVREEPIPGTVLLLDVLRGGTKTRERIAASGDVVIMGGAKLAVRAARLCQDAGTQRITILFRETADEIAWDRDDREWLAAAKVQVRYETSVRRLLGEEDRLTTVDIVNLATRSRDTLPAGALILAAGRYPELIFTPVTPPAAEGDAPVEPEADAVPGPLRWEAIEPYKQPIFIDETGLFAQGDSVTDHTAAIRAIGAARRAAASIHQAIYGIEPFLADNVVSPRATVQQIDAVHHVPPVPRTLAAPGPEPILLPRGAVRACTTDALARSEADRCLQCGLICYEHLENRGGCKQQAVV